jgi:ABC-type sugar transport system ATPase subunit
MLEIKSLAKQYPYAKLLFGALDLTAERGEMLCVLGGEGSGKTTLLKAIAGAESREGSVTLDGSEVTAKTDDVILVFEDGAVFANKTVFDNLAFPLTIRHMDKVQIAKNVLKAAELMGLTASLTTRAKSLSNLERKRLSMARIFVRDAKLVMLDCPARGLSEADANALWEDLSAGLRELKEKGVVIILAEDNAQRPTELADRFVCLHDGEVKQIGTYSEILNTPESIWAVQLLNKHYNFKKATLTSQNDMLKLDFGENVLDVTALKPQIAPSFFGKSVFAGWHPAPPSKLGEKEKVVSASRIFAPLSRTESFLLKTESGLHCIADKPLSVVSPLPQADDVTLFDLSENSIMRKEQ